MNYFRVPFAALVLLGTIATASAATIQNERGTFIQDRSGAWQRYIRLPRGAVMPYDVMLPNATFQPDVAGTNGN
jgi:hypothetical protein